MIEKFPYGKAPFWLFVVAVASTLLLAMVQGNQPRRSDLVMVTFTEAHFAAYQKALPRFERKHDVRVELQFADWSALQRRLQNAMLAGVDVPDVVELMESSLGFFTRGPEKDFGFMDLTDRVKGEGLDQRMVSQRFALWMARGRIYGIPHDVHPMMLAYRTDIIEKLGINVAELDTWDKFAAVGRKISKDLDGDGNPDRYMLEMPANGGWALQAMILQLGGGLFDAQGNITLVNEATERAFLWYLKHSRGPESIGYDVGWGQSVMQSLSDGLVLFYWTPDWRSYWFQEFAPKNKGKMALMPLPAFDPGGRRTSVWGGAGICISKATKRPQEAWELVKFLYFDEAELEPRFRGTNILPPLKQAWELPAFQAKNPYYSGQRVGKLYAELAPQTPPVYSGPVHNVAQSKLDQAFFRVATYYKERGDDGLLEKVRSELALAQKELEDLAYRNKVLEKAE